jgi:hypothetical protein
VGTAQIVSFYLDGIGHYCGDQLCTLAVPERLGCLLISQKASVIEIERGKTRDLRMNWLLFDSMPGAVSGALNVCSRIHLQYIELQQILHVMRSFLLLPGV